QASILSLLCGSRHRGSPPQQQTIVRNKAETIVRMEAAKIVTRYTQLHGHTAAWAQTAWAQTACAQLACAQLACAQLHAHSCMRAAACAQPFNTQDAVETWIGIPVILVEP